MIQLPPDYKNFFMLLNEKEVEYFLLGGFAVNIYGYHRMTEDLDVMIAPTIENGKKLFDALTSWGFDTREFQQENFSAPVHFRLGQPPNSIDIITHTKGISFEEAYPRTKAVTLDGVAVKVISIEDLIANKKSLNTYKDLADAEALTKIISLRK